MMRLSTRRFPWSRCCLLILAQVDDGIHGKPPMPQSSAFVTPLCLVWTLQYRAFVISRFLAETLLSAAEKLRAWHCPALRCSAAVQTEAVPCALPCGRLFLAWHRAHYIPYQAWRIPPTDPCACCARYLVAPSWRYSLAVGTSTSTLQTPKRGPKRQDRLARVIY